MTDRSSGMMIVVMSPQIAEHVQMIAESGWPGPVLVVGSVREAQQVVGGLRANAERERPAEPAPAPVRQLEPHGLRLDSDRRRVVHGAVSQQLTPLEFGVLELLLRSPGRVHRYADLTRTVWGVHYTGDPSPLHALVRRLRRKLEAVGAPVELEAVRGVGFRLGRPEAPVVGDLGAPVSLAAGG